jgi:hypothetical protein
VVHLAKAPGCSGGGKGRRRGQRTEWTAREQAEGEQGRGVVEEQDKGLRWRRRRRVVVHGGRGGVVHCTIRDKRHERQGNGDG